MFAQRVARGRDAHFIEPPIGERLGVEHGARVGSGLVHERTARFARDFFEQTEQGFDDFRLGVHFESRRARGPRHVAAERVLLGRRDVALGAVGELDVEGRGERRLPFQFQPGDGEDFVRDGGESDIADAQRLEYQLRLLPLVQFDGFERVNLRLRLREFFTELGRDLARPGEAFFIRHTVGEREPALGHFQRRIVAPLEAAHHRGHARGDDFRVSVVADVAGRRAVVHPHQVAARALAHDGDERGGCVGGDAEFGGDVLCEAPEVIRREQRRAVIVLGVVGEERERFSLARLHREHGELRVHRAARAGHVGALMAGVHVGAHVQFAKRVAQHFVGPANPAAVERVLRVILLRPADARGLQALHRADDGRGDAPRQVARIHRVNAAAETAHRRRRGVRVRRGNEHSFHRHPRRLARVGLCAVDEVARHHARIHHAEHDARFPIVERQRLHRERVHHLVRRALREHGIHPHGEFLRPDVHGKSPGAKLREGSTGNDEEEGERREEVHRAETGRHGGWGARLNPGAGCVMHAVLSGGCHIRANALSLPSMSPRHFLTVLAGTFALPAFAADPTFLDPADAGPDFAVQGEYVGESCAAQVIALGDGKFRIVGWDKGLPGAVADFEKKVEVDAKREGDKVVFNGNGWKGEIADGQLKGTNDEGKAWTIKRTVRESPTLGAKPPAGATVLFDGTNADAWEGGKMDERKLLAGGVKSKGKFGDCTLHVEFRTPFKPFARGQGRGNSGIYVQDRYECQVLDSFGLKGENNETGGIYSVAAPKLNMCFPPLSWQTYDIEFVAAKYEGDKKVKSAVMTVKLNGVLVQDGTEVPRITTAAGSKEGPEPGPIQLQAHGNPVFYRNIWIVEKK